MTTAQQQQRAGSKRSRSMMSSASTSVVLMAAALSMSGADGAFVAPSASPARSAHGRAKALAGGRPLVVPSAKRKSHLDASKRDNDGGRRNGHPLSPIFDTIFPEWLLRDPVQKAALEKRVATVCTTVGFTAGFSALFLTNPLLPHLPYSQSYARVNAEDELYAKYGGKGLDTSLVDKDCLVNKCSVQAKACLQDDPDCRKGLTCTAKCMGDNACITGCFARYGDQNLDNLLKCTIEDNECIKVAILDGGADQPGQEPRAPGPTVQNFDLKTMEGTWYKVAGFNPNYDCYACQRNTFSSPQGGLFEKAASSSNNGLVGAALNSLGGANELQVDVEFSMPRMTLEDGSPLPPSGVRESSADGLQSVAYNQYATHETMVFDTATNVGDQFSNLVLGNKGEEKLYSRTAHSEGEMFGLKFWENWYILGENDPGQDDFKFVYYNGKTRQNTYDGAFIYSRSRSLSPASMEKVYQIAKGAGMNPDQFCKIQNGCFDGQEERDGAPVQREGLGSPSNPFRGILASTKVSQLLGVESVSAETFPRSSAPSRVSTTIASDFLGPSQANEADQSRPWWDEVGDYLENPRRHFEFMNSLRVDMDWPDYVKQRN